jgi:hypothetical protein
MRKPPVPASASVTFAWMNRGVRSLLAFCVAGSVLVMFASWLLPIEVAQVWAVGRATNNVSSRFEAFETAAAVVWFLRSVSPMIALIAGVAWLRRRRTVPFLVAVATEFWAMVAPINVVSGRGDHPEDPHPRRTLGRVIGNTACRLLIAGWLVLAMSHAGASVYQRFRDWPVYKWNSGHAVLPNMSESNRDVIRYLEHATPPDSRILVVSDQKLFFLSYYLLPRRVYHVVHPDSEHVIPLAHLQRRLPAYRLEDLPESDVRRLRPDYVLEYFEHPDDVDRAHVLDDPDWVAFLRQTHHDSRHVPAYLVRLRRSREFDRP